MVIVLAIITLNLIWIYQVVSICITTKCDIGPTMIKYKFEDLGIKKTF